mmetsp:Transcript_4225/g.5490  ORF Transcript_4225/g.5490 Transcript_4225/m.5490 type:complete len:88 (-) Transcript_4225:585-848(-)
MLLIHPQKKFSKTTRKYVHFLYINTARWGHIFYKLAHLTKASAATIHPGAAVPICITSLIVPAMIPFSDTPAATFSVPFRVVSTIKA